MVLLKHKNHRDIAIKIIKSKGFLWWKRHLVELYNTNYADISGNLPIYLGTDWIRIKNFKDYRLVMYE
jgi:hypothetical protein